MAKEIERKFLVENTNFKVSATHSYEITQGYLSRRIDSTVRVRIKDDKAFLTVKGRNNGAVRDEWEYEIPVADARDMLEGVPTGLLSPKPAISYPLRGGYGKSMSSTGITRGLLSPKSNCLRLIRLSGFRFL